MLLLTGALTSKPYAFTARPWELRSVQSIDILDGIGSNTRVDFKETEILRILPKRNPDINESWISDKARFFYDALKRQRLNSPYMKVNGELRKVKWNKLLKNLTSVLKVYSFEYGSSKIGMVLGPSCDTETFFVAKDFASSFGFSNLGIDRNLNMSIDDPRTYLFNTEIKDLENVDFCLFVGTNPRFEASTLNLRLRKIFRKGCLKIASIGGNFSSTFPVQSLGLTSKTLLDFVEGKHPVCKSFAKAKNPIIIFGSSLLERADSRGIQNLLKNFALSFSSVFGKNIPTNILQTDPNIVGAAELGINNYRKDRLKTLKLLYCVNTENKDLMQAIKKNSDLPILVVQNSHGNIATNSADFVLPSTSFVEKGSTYYNTEGRPQKTQRALVGPNLARDDWKIFRVLFSFLKKTASYSTHSQLANRVSKILPSFHYANSWFLKRDGSLVIDFKASYTETQNIYISHFKLPIEDFYMTNQLCQSSRIMAKASQHLRSYFHNYKFMIQSN